MLNRRFVGLTVILCPCVLAAILSTAGRPAAAAGADPETIESQDPSGQLRTLNVNGTFDLDNPFFQDLGTNGRRCVTCHQPGAAWSITPANVQERFRSRAGLIRSSPITTGRTARVRSRTRSRRSAPRTDSC